MTSLIKKFKAARAEKKAKKPYKALIVTSDFIDGGQSRNNLTGKSHDISVKAHFVAASKTKVDPQKGPDSVLWDIHEEGVYKGQSFSQAVKLSITYKDMLKTMLKTMLLAEKIGVDQASRPDAEFIKERRPLVAKNNILMFV